MKPIKMGIIGSGLSFQRRHYPIIRKMEDKFEITSILLEQGVEADSEFKNIFCTDDEDEFYSRGEFEAVDICTPIYLHYDQILKALDNGKWVLVEKPVVGNIDEVESLFSIPQNKKDKVLVAENFRFIKSIKELKKIMCERSDIPIYVEFQNFTLWDANNPYSSTSWRRKPKHEGGVLLDGGIHLVSTLRWLFGEITVVDRKLFSLTGLFGLHDTALVSFITPQGTHGSLKLSYGLHDDDQAIVKVYFNGYSFFCAKTSLTIFSNGRRESINYEKDSDIISEFNHFYKLIRLGEKPHYPLEEALSDVKSTLHFFCNYARL